MKNFKRARVYYRLNVTNFIKIIFFLFSIILSTNSFGQNQYQIVQITYDSNVVFKTTSFEGVIFGRNYKERMRLNRNKIVEHNPLIRISQDTNSKRFVPSIEMVIDIEPVLKRYFKFRKQIISDSLSNYVKQYYGYIKSNNDSIIYINCFRDEYQKKNNNWYIVFMRNPNYSTNYFTIRYNVTRKRFFDFCINCKEKNIAPIIYK